MCPFSSGHISFLPRNSSLGGFFKFVKMCGFYYFLFLKASAYFNCTEMPKIYIFATFLKEIYIILLSSEFKNIQGQQSNFRCLVNLQH